MISEVLLLSCALLANDGFTSQVSLRPPVFDNRVRFEKVQPDPEGARRKALEAERDKLMKRLGEIEAELARLRTKKDDVVHIEDFLGISADFSVFARWDSGGLVFTELATGKKLPAPAWDRDWGRPRTVLFGADFIAVPAGTSFTSSTADSVKIFPRKTLELERNIRARIDAACLTSGNRFLALAEHDDDGHWHLVLDDVTARKSVAEIDFGRRHISVGMAAAGKCVAVVFADGFGSDSTGLIHLVDGETGKLSAKIKTDAFHKKKNAQRLPMPLAVSSSGHLLACGADDAVVLYDVAGEKVVHRFEGHLDVVRAVAISPKGDIVASSSKDKTVRFWKVDTGETVHTIKNLSAVVSALTFSPDGKRILLVLGEKEKRRNGDVPAEIRDVEPK